MMPMGKEEIMAKMLKLALIRTECGEILGLGHSQTQWRLGGKQREGAGDSGTPLS